MPYEICRHICTTGERCRAAALKGDFWCFFHAKLHGRHRALRTQSTPPDAIQLPALEDSKAIQVAVSLVVSALALGRIDEKRARVLILGLNLAARSAECLILYRTSDNHVTSCSPTFDGLPLASRAMSDNSTPPPPPVSLAEVIEKLQHLPSAAPETPACPTPTPRT